MKNFDLVTSHNITIEYQLASILERFLAWLIDSVILLVWYFICATVATSVARTSAYSFWDTDSWYYWVMIVSLLFGPVYVFYHLIFEIFVGGASPGKLILGIKVVNLKGQNPIISECFLRWTFRPVEILLTAGALAAIFISSSEKSQRVGDLVARTVVIKLRPTVRYSLKDVLSIKTSQEYKPQHLQVVKFSEDEMLYVKNCVDRSRQYQNPATKKLLNEITIKICDQLGIKVIPEPRKQADFLKGIIQDYVVLTRS